MQDECKQKEKEIEKLMDRHNKEVSDIIAKETDTEERYWQMVKEKNQF